MLRKLVFLVGVLILLLGASLGGLFFYFSINLPSLEEISNIPLVQSTKIYDRTGKHLLYEIHGSEKRTIVPENKIPLYLKEATIAIEDKDFYKHPAFDWKAILRAIFTNLMHRRIVQGGSTITQQVVKNAFLTPRKTLERKIKEIILAYRLEKKYSKDKILWYYLNLVSYGSNIYGVQEAAKTYFGKDVSQISLAEAALLASLPQAPSYYSPYGNHFDDLLKRKNLVLEEMYKDGYISKEELEEAKKEKIKILPKRETISAPHFVMYVKELLAKKYGDDLLEKGGLKIYTTLDWEIQKLAEETIKWGVERNRKLANANNAGMIVEDARTGEILAMVGSYDYFDIKNQGNFNVCLAKRQPGSSFKPIVYLAAFLKGYPDNTILFDLPTNFDITHRPERRYIPQNFDHKYRGPVSLREALAQSINVVAVKLLYLVGIKDAISLAKKLGVSTLSDDPWHYGLSLVLGGGEVRLLDMVKVYSVFAQNGILRDQVFILKVVDSKGNILEEYKVGKGEQIVDPEKVKILNSVLSDNKARAPLFGGENNSVQIPDREIAAKTGTTNNSRDAWIFAYTPSYVVGIWAGNNDNSPMLKEGSSILLAVPMWHYFAEKFFKDKEKEVFEKPKPYKVDKPMLDGNYIIPYLENGVLKPQIHNILWYIDKKDPLGLPPADPERDLQFENWEKPVINWIKRKEIKLPNLNQPISYQTKLHPIFISTSNSDKENIKILSPQSGSFVEKNISLKVFAPRRISFLEVYLNEKLIRIFNNLPSGENTISLTLEELKLQNELVISGELDNGKVFRKKLILFKKVSKTEN